MLKSFDKYSGKRVKSKVIKSGLIVATVGTIIFGVMFGGQIYESAEDVYRNSKAKVVATYQDFKTSTQKSKEESSIKALLNKLSKDKKSQVETGSLVDISLGVMENAEQLKNESLSLNKIKKEIAENSKENQLKKEVVTSQSKTEKSNKSKSDTKVFPEIKTVSPAGISLGVVESALKPTSKKSVENESKTTEKLTEESVVRTRTVSLKETSISQGKVVSSNTQEVLTGASSNTEAELKSTFDDITKDLGDNISNNSGVKNKAEEKTSEGLNVEKSVATENEENDSAVVTIITKSEKTTEDKVVNTRTETLKKSSTSQTKAIPNKVDKISTQVTFNQADSQATFSTNSNDSGDGSKVKEKNELQEQNEQSNNDKGSYLDTFKKPYSPEVFCADIFRNRILEDFIKKSGQNFSFKYINSLGEETRGTINSTQLLSIYDYYRNSPSSVFRFAGKTFAFDNNGKLISSEKENVIDSEFMGKYLDDVNFKLGVNVMVSNLNGYNPTPITSATNNPNIMSAVDINNYSNGNMQMYYDFKTGYYLPVSENIQSSISAKIFGAKDYTSGVSVISTGLQGDIKFFSDIDLIEFSSGVAYSNKGTLSGSFGASYNTFTKNNDTIGVYAGIETLHNTISKDTSFAVTVGASIGLGGNSNKKVLINNSFDMSGNYASNYDLNNPNPQSHSTQNGNGQGQNPINPDGPTIIPPYDDGRGMEQGQ